MKQDPTVRRSGEEGPIELPVGDAGAPRTKIERDLAVERWIAEGEREFASLEEMLECTDRCPGGE